MNKFDIFKNKYLVLKTRGINYYDSQNKIKHWMKMRGKPQIGRKGVQGREGGRETYLE